MNGNRKSDDNDRNKKKTRAGTPNIRNSSFNCDMPGGNVAGDRVFVRDEKTGKEVYCYIVGDTNKV